MPYIQRSAPTLNTLDDVRQWVEDELGYIEQAQHDTLVLELKPSFVDVDKPREGMIVYADGTHFNPGLGAGSYEYRGGAWHKLAEDIDLSEIETDITDLEAAVAGPHASAGFTNGSNAPAGDVGEYKSSFVLFGAAVTASSDVDTQVTSLVLPAGDWDLSGEVFVQSNAGDIETIAYAINTAVVADIYLSLPVEGLDSGRFNVTGTGTGHMSLPGLRTRANITSPTTYLLVVNVGYSAGDGIAWGALRARRVR